MFDIKISKYSKNIFEINITNIIYLKKYQSFRFIQVEEALEKEYERVKNPM